jgi:hypothetical protein
MSFYERGDDPGFKYSANGKSMGGGDYSASAETNAELLRVQRPEFASGRQWATAILVTYTLLPSYFGLDISSATYRLTIGRS